MQKKKLGGESLFDATVREVNEDEFPEEFWDNCVMLCNSCGLNSSSEALEDGKCRRCGGEVTEIED